MVRTLFFGFYESMLDMYITDTNMCKCIYKHDIIAYSTAICIGKPVVEREDSVIRSSGIDHVKESDFMQDCFASYHVVERVAL